MNGRTAKLLRQIFPPSDGPDKRREYQAFKRAYTRTTSPKQREVQRMATKIAEVRKGGHEVKHFRIDEQTHQAVEVKDE